MPRFYERNTDQLFHVLIWNFTHEILSGALGIPPVLLPLWTMPILTILFLSNTIWCKPTFIGKPCVDSKFLILSKTLIWVTRLSFSCSFSTCVFFGLNGIFFMIFCKIILTRYLVKPVFMEAFLMEIFCFFEYALLTVLTSSSWTGRSLFAAVLLRRSVTVPCLLNDQQWSWSTACSVNSLHDILNPISGTSTGIGTIVVQQIFDHGGQA